MSKPTIGQKCALHGISKDVWQAAKAAGVNPWNDAEMGAWVKARRPRIAKAAKLPASNEAAGDAPTVEMMEDRMRRAESYEEVKIWKEKLAGAKVAQAVRIEAKELVPAGEVKESAHRMYSIVRGEIIKLANDLPPRLEGLAAGPMQAIMREAIHEILTRLSDESSALYE